jgi:imidazole glycerol-phosphate synthase subunit HisH
MKIAIVNYGTGNIQSVSFALKRIGYTGFLTNKPTEILTSDRVIFPGVGEASSAMKKLRASGLHEIIPDLKQPVLGICLGMQLLCNDSEEGNTRGLGIFNVSVKRFSDAVKVPHMGWNSINNLKSHLFDNVQEKEYMYLVHSYYAPLSEETVAVTNYGQNYSSALKKDNFYGVQFHPEKSGRAGEKILENFLKLQ